MEWKCASCSAMNPDTAHFCSSCGAPNPGVAGAVQDFAAPEAPPAEVVRTPPGAVLPPPAKKKRSVALIVIIVLAVLLIPCLIVGGIVAAIAVPNILDAMQRSRQKRAVGDVRDIAVAVLEYRIENGVVPDTGHEGDLYYSTVDAKELEKFLCPKHIKEIPEKDGWGHPYQYGVSPDNLEFILICSGSDGVTEITEMPAEIVMKSCYEDDIVWENDKFVQMPEGRQKKCK